jgi:hypothetical protein
MRRAERHEWVCLLKEQGCTFKEIADTMGVAVSSVTSAYYDPTGEAARARKARYGGTCGDCGAPTSYIAGGVPKRCRRCNRTHLASMEGRRGAAARATGKVQWTNEAIFEAIRSVAIDGRVSCTNYDSAASRSGGTMPSRPTMIWRFGSWRNVVAAAGLRVVAENRPKVYRNRISEDGLLMALEDCAAELGHWPAAREYEQWSTGGVAPTIGVLRQRFGSWMVALERAMEASELEKAA